jgi:molybdopterin synthase catalytic subunit
MIMIRIILQKEPIDVTAFLNDVGTDEDGAVVSFIGRARCWSNNREVRYLEYEAYEGMAEKELHRIARDAMERWQLTDVVIVHRFGRVEIGASSILISVSSAHRDEAFQSARYIIDTIKKTVPIWKKEFYSDGSMWISERS